MLYSLCLLYIFYFCYFVFIVYICFSYVILEGIANILFMRLEKY